MTTSLTSVPIEGSTAARPLRSRIGKLWPLAAALAVYVVVVVPLAYHQRDRINPDAVSYLQRARMLVDGDFRQSVSAYWSPMISWCIAPLLAAGVDGVYAARIVMCVWGAIYLIAFDVLLGRLLTITPRWRCGVLVVMALAVASPAVKQITPDVMMAAWILFNMAVMAGPGLLQSKRQALLAGALAGVTFTAKAYALPFLGVHLVFTVLLRILSARRCAAVDRRWAVVRSGVLWLAIAGVTMGIIAGAWVGVLSSEYHQLIISTSGRRAHSMVGPKDRPRVPAAAFDTTAESVAPDRPRTPKGSSGASLIRKKELEREAFGAWSPFDSRAYFMHQVKVMAGHTRQMLISVRDFDVLHLTTLGVLIAGGLALGLGRLAGPRWVVVWLAGTIPLFCSGLTMVYYTPRYTLPMLLPMGLLLSLILAMRLEVGAYHVAAVGAWQSLRRILPVVVLASFGIAAMVRFNETWKLKTMGLYRAVAQEIHRQKLAGPIASAEIHNGMYVAYHARMGFMGFPPGNDIAKVEQALLVRHCGVLVIWHDPKPDPAYAVACKLSRGFDPRAGWKVVKVLARAKNQGATILVPQAAEVDKNGKPG